MTLGITWLRLVGGVQELVVVSDSRLSGGQYWDANPKIVILPRTDSVLSFSGDTNDAYPLMLQAWNAIKMHEPAENRSLDISKLKGHIIRLFNHSRKFITGLPNGQDKPTDPDVRFLFSGFSWRTKKFHIWEIYYDKSIKKFTFRPIKNWTSADGPSRKLVTYVGDKEAINDARARLTTILKQRNKLLDGSFDMEPFEVLRDIIRSGRFSSVGGPIQMVKIYEHSNVKPVAVLWPSKSDGVASIFGRPLMDYEILPWGIIDPDQPQRIIPFSQFRSERSHIF